MRKGALLLAALLAASITTTADAAKRKAAAPKADPAVQATKDSMSFMHDAMFPLTAKSATAPAKKSAKRGKRAKKG